MNLSLSFSISALLLVLLNNSNHQNVQAFSVQPMTTTSRKGSTSTSLDMSAVAPDDDKFNLQRYDMPGNAGFDPLGFAKDEETLLRYRDSEVKHGRLAMMVIATVMISGLYDGSIANWEEVHSFFTDVGRIPELWGFCVGLTATTDMYELAKAESEGNDHIPGSVGFDPLNLYPTDKEGQDLMQLAEIKHSRVAMLAVSYLLFQEGMKYFIILNENWDLLEMVQTA